MLPPASTSLSTDAPPERAPPSRAQLTFSSWLDTIDPDIRKAIVEPRSWFGVTVIAVLVILVAGIVPVTRDFFRLWALPALLIYLPTPALGIAIGTLEKRGSLTLSSFGGWCILGSLLFQSFMWALVALSEPPGSAVLAALPILLAAYHGHVFRSAPQTPYIALATGVSLIVALLLNHDAAHLSIYTVAGPVAIGSALLLGRNAIVNHRSRIGSIALREAVDAQILSERARHVEVITQALDRMHGTNHDAGNALSAALFNVEQLILEVQRRPLNDDRCERIGVMGADLLSSLERLRALLEDARGNAQDSRPALERVDVPGCVREVLDQAKARFPHLKARLQMVEPTLEHASIPVSGGAVSLSRILTNLVINACEGNGTVNATSVEITISEDPRRELLMLTVADDGPGFSAAMLAAPFRGFHTTKAGGTGLGLYTAERLLRASGGTLRIANDDRGVGGRVHLTLRR